jgi:prefoldin subunit 5
MNLNFSEETERNTIEYLSHRVEALEKELKLTKESLAELRKMYVKAIITM